MIGTFREDADGERLKRERIETHRLELSDTESIDNFVTYLSNATPGGIDLLINNAAFGRLQPVSTASMRQIAEPFIVNTIGTCYLTSQLLRLLALRPNAKVFFCSSLLSMLPVPNKGPYAASKAALEILVSGLRMESKTSNVRLSTFVLGPIERTCAHTDKLPTKNLIKWACQEEEICITFQRVVAARNPRTYYYVGFSTKVARILSRLLPKSGLEFLGRRF